MPVDIRGGALAVGVAHILAVLWRSLQGTLTTSLKAYPVVHFRTGTGPLLPRILPLSAMPLEAAPVSRDQILEVRLPAEQATLNSVVGPDSFQGLARSTEAGVAEAPTIQETARTGWALVAALLARVAVVAAPEHQTPLQTAPQELVQVVVAAGPSAAQAPLVRTAE